MKECISCGYKCDDDVIECPECCDTQFVRICPNCSSPLDGTSCPVCGYLTDEGIVGSYGAPRVAEIKPLEKERDDAYKALLYSVLSIMACGIPLFSIPAIIYAVKGIKSGDDFKKIVASLIIIVLSFVELALVYELYLGPIMFY